MVRTKEAIEKQITACRHEMTRCKNGIISHRERIRDLAWIIEQCKKELNEHTGNL